MARANMEELRERARGLLQQGLSEDKTAARLGVSRGFVWRTKHLEEARAHDRLYRAAKRSQQRASTHAPFDPAARWRTEA